MCVKELFSVSIAYMTCVFSKQIRQLIYIDVHVSHYLVTVFFETIWPTSTYYPKQEN